jgi:hypothetical protein
MHYECGRVTEVLFAAGHKMFQTISLFKKDNPKFWRCEM